MSRSIINVHSLARLHLRRPLRTGTLLQPRCLHHPVSLNPSRQSSIGRRIETHDEKHDMDNAEMALDAKPRNPLDTIAMSRLEATRRAYYTRRLYIAGAGIMFSLMMTLLIVYNVELPPPPAPSERDSATASVTNSGDAFGRTSRQSSLLPVDRADSDPARTASFSGKPVVLQPGTSKPLAHDPASGQDIELVPTGTSTIPYFPRTITIPSSSPTNSDSTTYTLLGLGIRTVSFLSIQVYVVGFYVNNESLPALQSALIKHINPSASALIPAEKAQLQTALLDPEASQRIWDAVLTDEGLRLKSAFRIVPVRSTDFAHLRDGWVRGITARTQAAAREQAVKSATTSAADANTIGGAAQAVERSRFDDERFGEAMRDFKALFGGRGKAPKGSVMTLRRDGQGALDVLVQDKEGADMVRLGRVGDERVSRLVWLGYLGGKNVSSEGARKGVVEGLVSLVERPVGTVETKVE